LRFPTHWVSDKHEAHDRAGELVTRYAYGWSSISDDDARRVARERAKRAVDYAIAGTSQARDEYGYGVDPAREELIDSLEVEDHAEPLAAVTRNRYGALVLNTEQLLFADVDQPKPTGGFFARLFGKGPDPVDTMREQIRTWHASRPRHSLRLYQTAAGFRIVFTESPHEPTAPQTVELLKSLGSDPLYVRLCQRQKCFRARLTPKPWRCGIDTPGILFPYASPQHEQRQRAWEDGYIAACTNYATCRLLDTFGNPSVHPTLAPIVDLHDQYTLNDSRPLA
jgi:hypothetical protein